MSVRQRSILVTILLVVTGAICGAIVAVVVTTGIVVARHGFDEQRLVDVVPAMARPGAVIGALFAPVLGWSDLRHVPIGRAIVGVTVAPILVASIGWFIYPPLAIPLSIAGLVGGVMWLSRRSPRAREPETSDPSGPI